MKQSWNRDMPSACWLRAVLALGLGAAAGAVQAQSACGLPPGTPIFGLTGDQRLLEYAIPVANGTNQPPRVVAAFLTTQTIPSTLIPTVDNLVSIDFRPANLNESALYAVTDKGDIKLLNAFPAPPFGLGTALSAVNVSMPGIAFQSGLHSGMDFNPVVDAVRLVGSDDQNFAIVNANGGNLNTGVAQTTLRYAAGDVAAGADPYITAAAYDNNLPGATRTTFYMLDYVRDTLVTIADRTATGSSNTGGGMLKTIGRLLEPSGAPFNISPGAALDIVTTGGRNVLVGYSTQRMFCVDLATVNADMPLGTTRDVTVQPAVQTVSPNTGAASFLAVAENLVGIAVAPRPPVSANLSLTLVRSPASTTPVRLGSAVSFSATIRNDGPSVATGLQVTFNVNQNANGVNTPLDATNILTGGGICAPAPALPSIRSSVLCRMPSLQSGKQINMSLTVQTLRPVSNPGSNTTLNVIATENSLVPDPTLGNDSVALSTPLQF